MIQATQLKRGMCIKHDNDLYRVVEAHAQDPRQPARAWCRRRSGTSRRGSISDHRFRSVDMVERAILDETEMEFLYQDGDMYHFMNNETYEQIGLSDEVLGDAVPYLIPNIKLKIEMYEDRPVGIDLPLHGRDDGHGDGARDQGRQRLERGQARQDGDGAHRAGARRSSPRASASASTPRAAPTSSASSSALPVNHPAASRLRLDRGRHRQHVQRQERGAHPPGAPRADRPPARAALQAARRRPLRRATRSSATPT